MELATEVEIERKKCTLAVMDEARIHFGLARSAAEAGDMVRAADMTMIANALNRAAIRLMKEGRRDCDCVEAHEPQCREAV